MKALIFDFDGVLVASNAIKRQAYERLFAGKGKDAAGEVRRVLARHPDGDRYETLRHLLLEFRRLGRLSTESSVKALVEDYAERYGQMCEAAIAACPETEGAAAFLSVWSSRLPLFINSDTPRDSLRQIVAQREWERFFRDILGRPQTKEQNLRMVLASGGWKASEIIFVGDRQKDWAAAKTVGCRFAAIESDENDFVGIPEIQIKTLQGLERVAIEPAHFRS
jgi:phosphoglycolate phosphatase